MTLQPQSPPAGEELELIMAITSSYVEDAKYHEPNLTSGQLYEKYRVEATDDLNAYILAEVLKLIGEDKKWDVSKDDYGFRDQGKNELRAELRAAAQARFGGEGGTQDAPIS